MNLKHNGLKTSFTLLRLKEQGESPCQGGRKSRRVRIMWVRLTPWVSDYFVWAFPKNGSSLHMYSTRPVYQPVPPFFIWASLQIIAMSVSNSDTLLFHELFLFGLSFWKWHRSYPTPLSSILAHSIRNPQQQILHHPTLLFLLFQLNIPSFQELITESNLQHHLPTAEPYVLTPLSKVSTHVCILWLHLVFSLFFLFFSFYSFMGIKRCELF